MLSQALHGLNLPSPGGSLECLSGGEGSYGLRLPMCLPSLEWNFTLSLTFRPHLHISDIKVSSIQFTVYKGLFQPSLH